MEWLNAHRSAVSNAMQRAALQVASAIYQSAEMRVLRMCYQAEQELYAQLAKRYKAYNSPEAKQRRQWDAESEEYHSIVGN